MVTRLFPAIFLLCLCACASALSLPAAPLKSGDIIALECQGHVEGARWLEARPEAKAVVLSTESGQSLGRWRVHVFADGLVSLRCHAASRSIYLNGVTTRGAVSLAPENSEKFTGTHWKVIDHGEGVISLECQGDLAGPRWLDGRTVERDAILTTALENSGVRWRVHPAK